MGIVDQWLANFVGGQTGQQAYDSARSAGASTGRARVMAQNAAKQAGEQPAAGMAYDAGAAQPSWWQNLVQQTQPAPQANPQEPTPVYGPIVGAASGSSQGRIQPAAQEREAEEKPANGKKASFSSGGGKVAKSNYEKYIENALGQDQAEPQQDLSGANMGDLMMARSMAGLSGDEELKDMYGQEVAENFGTAAGIANPVGAARGLLSAARAAKAEKLLGKAAKLEEKASKGKKAAQAAETAKAEKAAAEAGKAEEAAKATEKDLRGATPAEQALKAAEDEGDVAAAAMAARRANYGQGTFAKAAAAASKPASPKDLVIPGAAAGGLLATLLAFGATDPEMAGKPMGEALASWKPIESGKANGNADFLGPMPADMNEAVQVYGMLLADYMALTQRQQYVDALANDEDLRNYYAETYADQDQWGDLLGDLGYEAFRDIGDRGDYQYKHDLVRDLFGYNKDDEGNARYGIKGWNDMAAGAIPGLRDMDDEEAIQAILDYMWADRIDPYLYSTDAQYASSRNLGDLDSAYYLGQYLGNNYIGNEGTDNFLGSLTDAEGNPLYNLDNEDLGAMFMTANLMNQGIGGNFDESDLALVNELLGLSGDNATFSFAGDDDEGFDWNYDPKRRYQIANMLNQLKDQQMDIAANGGRGDQYALNVYSGEDVDSDLIDANLADDLMGYLEAQTGRRLTRS